MPPAKICLYIHSLERFFCISLRPHIEWIYQVGLKGGFICQFARYKTLFIFANII